MDKNLKLQNNKDQYYPPQNKPRKQYYTINDVKVHNTANDCWVTFFHQVYDLTDLIQSNIQSSLCQPIVQAAGTDITHWFEPETREPRKQVDLKTGLEVYYCPQGQYLHIPTGNPVAETEDLGVATPWWRNTKYMIGKLTVKSRKIKIINMLTDHEDIIEVPCEETINEILERYKQINEHASSYTWKRLGRPIDMEKTLEENNIADETDEFERLDIPEEEWYIPAIHLYFNDDLTVA